MWSRKQLKALDESIAHWERMRKDPIGCYRANEAPDDLGCACCMTFKEDKGQCGDCPIAQATDLPDCRGISYEDANRAFGRAIRYWREDPAEWLDWMVEWRDKSAIVLKELHAIRDGTLYECLECEGAGKFICQFCDGSGCRSCQGGEVSCPKCHNGKTEDARIFQGGKRAWW